MEQIDRDVRIADAPRATSPATPPPAPPEPAGRGPTRAVWLGLIAVLLAAAAAVAAVLALTGDDGDSPDRAAGRPASAVSLAALTAAAREADHPIYWAGELAGFTYELTTTADGRTYIRYLPSGVAVGSGDPDYLTIGTYPVQDAVGIVRAIGETGAGTVVDIPGGGIAAISGDHPLSTYVAFPGQDYEIEVYDPTPGRSRELVEAGLLAPVPESAGDAANGASEPVGPRAASVAQLGRLAASAGIPVYWVGARDGATYEWSRTGDGRTYVRYLVDGAQVGDRRPHLTVGTYPVDDGLAAVTAIGERAGGRTIDLGDGIVGAVDPAHPTSVYVGWPGARVQVEVFSPAAGEARELVRAGMLAPLG